MEYIEPMDQIKFGATGAEEVFQNVAFILSTAIASCPLDRSFGWDMYIDKPIHIAKAKIAARLTSAIHHFEPRAIVHEVTFDGDVAAGKLQPKVKVSIRE